MAYQYDDRTTRYNPHDSYGRHGDSGADYDDEYGVSHSHPYGHHGYEYPPQQHRRYRNPPTPAPVEYEYGQGLYDYPTGVADPSAAAAAPYASAGHDAYDAPHEPDHSYEAAPHDGGYAHTTPAAYGGVYARSNPGDYARSNPSAHGEEYAGSNPGIDGGGYAGPSTGAYDAGHGSGHSMLGDVYHADQTYGRDHVRDRKARPQLLGTAFCFLFLAGIGVACGVMLAVVFIRPPNVGVAGYASPSIYLQDQALMVNTTVYAAVSNPNSIGAKVKHMHATIYERNVRDHVLGTSQNKNLQIGSHSNTTLKFPVQFQLASANNLTASAETLQDVAQNCGWDLTSLTGAPGNKLTSYTPRSPPHALVKRSNTIPLLVDLDIKVSVMAVDFHTPVHNFSLNVACPNLANLFGAIGSGSSTTPSSTTSTSSSSSVVVVPTYHSTSSTPSSTYILTSTLTSTSTSTTPTSTSTRRTTSTYVPPTTSIYTETLTQTVAPTTSTHPSSTPIYTSTNVPATTYSPSTTTTYTPTTTTVSYTPTPTSTRTTASLPPPITPESSQDSSGRSSSLSSVASNAQGEDNAWNNIWSFITAGSMPIRRTVPTSRPI